MKSFTFNMLDFLYNSDDKFTMDVRSRLTSNIILHTCVTQVGSLAYLSRKLEILEYGLAETFLFLSSEESIDSSDYTQRDVMARLLDARFK